MATASDEVGDPGMTKEKLPPTMIISLEEVLFVQNVPARTAGAAAGRALGRGDCWVVGVCLVKSCESFLCESQDAAGTRRFKVLWEPVVETVPLRLDPSGEIAGPLSSPF